MSDGGDIIRSGVNYGGTLLVPSNSHGSHSSKRYGNM